MRLRNGRNGDLIKIVREVSLRDGRPISYTHFGIYVDEADGGHVIHYSGHGDFKGTVLETPLEKFLQGSKRCSRVRDFSKFSHVYSGEETVERARASIGQGMYDLLMNNCETFAYWCKTGESYASQTELLDPIKFVGDGIANILIKFLR